MAKVHTALFSVSDKRGIIDFARRLVDLGVQIISTGGTADVLEEAGLPIKQVSDITGFPEMLDGRVKTLHPRIHAGILALRDNPEHMSTLKEHEIAPIDLVVVNLYPFKQVASRPEVEEEEVIENIDIGGPTLLRAAAKNFAHVGVVVNPEDYSSIAQELEGKSELSPQTLRHLAQLAFEHTASYDAAIASYFQREEGELFPSRYFLEGEKMAELRYGENPHQRAAIYRQGSGIVDAEQLQGKELSFNNYADADAAISLAFDLPHPGVAIIKHANPCGAARGATISEAYSKAYQADPISAFGGIVAANELLDESTAQQIISTFMEVIIAPAYEENALEVLAQKKNMRVLRLPEGWQPGGVEFRSLSGGFLAQEKDLVLLDESKCQYATSSKPTPEQEEDLRFAWAVVKNVKSNAIVVAKDGVTLGIGAGQMNRVGAVKIALEQAGEAAKGAVLASDGFFPFADSVEEAASAGIAAIIQPGGSRRDEEVVAAAEKHGIAMLLAGLRHFRH